MRTSDGAVFVAYSFPSSGWGISDRFPSLPPLLFFFLFYGHSLVRGVVVSGGDGVQWKVAEGKAARFSCT